MFDYRDEMDRASVFLTSMSTPLSVTPDIGRFSLSFASTRAETRAENRFNAVNAGLLFMSFTPRL